MSPMLAAPLNPHSGPIDRKATNGLMAITSTFGLTLKWFSSKEFHILSG